MKLGQRAGLTDTGRKRRRNEDAFVLRPPIFAVADGMGGAQAGEVASRLATEALWHRGGGDREERVSQLVQEANRRVYERAHEDSAASGMGTTMTVAMLDEDGLVTIGHVGDSRAYLARAGTLEQLTEDHSLVAELMRSGKLSADEAESHPQRSVITRALGTDPDVDVDLFTVEARPGDVFLLCSDGLTTMVGDDTILVVLEEHRGDLEAAARALVSRANRGGGEDNITVVCFEILEDAAPDPAGDTARISAPAEPASDPDDEDTLSGLDRVPAVDTMVVAPEQAAAIAVSPDTRRERLDRIARRVLVVFAVLALLLGASALVLWGVAR